MILVYGKTGQVALELQRRAADAIFLGRDQADLSEPSSAALHIADIKPSVVINAAAYTAVDKAEDEPVLAGTINGDAVGAMGRACAALDIPMVHISTDYVFAGDGEKPWTPADPTAPAGSYGASKLAGEAALRDGGARHAILRTSWVFSAHGNNFVKTMLRLGAERDRLTIVADQIGGPTPAAAIADACLTMAHAIVNGHDGGTHHFSGAPDVSWADFARAIFRQSGLSPDVVDIPSSAFPTKAKRPLNSRLDCSSLDADFGITRPDWEAALDAVLEELKQKSA
ncbi:MAG: dTDP-4-dehydrorhamnose reductase [Pseudomonadota bacterium]